jgi:phosphotransferase family enzyme
VDPALPTLPRALQLPRVGRLVEPEPPPGTVEVVRHAREGTCVLHFSSGDQQGGQTVDGQHARGVYGKVYGQSAAQTGDHVLGMLLELRSSVDPAAVRLPEPLWYDRRGKMLLTRALPGAPLLPARLKQLFAPDAAAGDRPGQAADLLELIRAAGSLLASLHRAAVPSAPVHLLAAELERVTDQLEVVAEVWQDSAAQVSRLVMALVRHAAPAPRLVVCHGDFTPSQLLLVSAGDSGRPDQVSLGGLVDLDTACWADPALDLGRFLAHVDLLATKIGGRATEHCRAEIAGVLLDGYRDQAALGGIDDRELVRRVAVFRGLSLARTALRSCRQLKDDRFSIALSLLETAHTWTGKAD